MLPHDGEGEATPNHRRQMPAPDACHHNNALPAAAVDGDAHHPIIGIRNMKLYVLLKGLSI
jgi:hypothetical protein